MQIAVIGAQNTGKSFLIESFLKKYTIYAKPKKTYRDFIDKEKLQLNEEATTESQTFIRDALIKQILECDEKNVIHDRCVIDNLIYTMWAVNEGKMDGEEITKTLIAIREAIRKYDLIFYLPLVENNYELTEDATRSSNEVFRQSIGELYETVIQSYRDHTGAVFPIEDCPAVIELSGDETKGEKMTIIENYIDPETGDVPEEDGESAFDALQDVADKESAIRAVGFVDKNAKDIVFD